MKKGDIDLNCLLSKCFVSLSVSSVRPGRSLLYCPSAVLPIERSHIPSR